MLRQLMMTALTSCGVVAAATQPSGVTEYFEMCDASAAVAVDDDLFLVANDEDPDGVTLRLFRQRPDAGHHGPVQLFPISRAFLDLEHDHREVDVEGAARVGDLVYWIGSHSTSKDGKKRPNRRRLFAVRVGPTSVKEEGKPYKSLVDDLRGDDRFNRFHLKDASETAPKDPGGLSIEGLAATPAGGLLIGFRNPIKDHKALVVRLENPGEVIRGKKARFGEPITLDLWGLGVRSMELRPDGVGYLIVAGPFGEADEESRLYRWSGDPDAKPEVVAQVTFPGLNPEALFFSGGRVMALSDDGTRKEAGLGRECKLLAPAEQKFRGVPVRP